jgi:hypothetical protein
MNDAPEPTELIYPPRSSWAPALLAGGLAGAIAGFTFLWWPYGVIGAAVALCALVSFLRHSWRDLVRLPRRQPVATAPLPLTRRTRKAPETSDAT